MSYEKDDAELLKKLGARIRFLREKKGISQEDFSFACELHRTYISSVERGERNIAIINLRKIASALDISLAQLLNGVDNVEAEQ